MADPDTDHGFVYTEGGYVDILASPFFDVKLGFDTTVDGYVDRIRYTLVKAVELQLGLYARSELEDDEYPLHPSYVALQTLYLRHPSPGSSSVADTPSPPRFSTGNPTGIRYLCWTLIVVALSILIRIFCRILV